MSSEIEDLEVALVAVQRKYNFLHISVSTTRDRPIFSATVIFQPGAPGIIAEAKTLREAVISATSEALNRFPPNPARKERLTDEQANKLIDLIRRA